MHLMLLYRILLSSLNNALGHVNFPYYPQKCKSLFLTFKNVDFFTCSSVPWHVRESVCKDIEN